MNVTASVQIFKTPGMEICSSSHHQDKQHRKTPWLLKQPLINLAPSTSFLGLSLLFVGPVSDFTPRRSWGYNDTSNFLGNMGGQGMETLGHAPWEERNLPTETPPRLISYKCLITEDRDHLLTNKHLPKSFPSLSQWTRQFGLRLTPCACIPCPWIQPTPNPQWLTCELYSMHLGVAIPLLFLKKKKTWFLLFWACLANFLYLSSQVQIQRNWKQGLNGDLYNRVCSDIIHSSQQAESTWARAHQKMNG